MLNRENQNKMEPFDVCNKGIRELFANAPKESLLDNSVIAEAKKTKFKVEKITLIKLLGDFECDVVVKDDKGHRSYRIQLEKNNDFPHLYKIIDVQGQKIVSSYQWRNEI